MSANTHIQWCNSTFNPWIGCTKVSPGCANCYAEANAASKFLGVKWGKGQGRYRTKESTWRRVLDWNRAAGKSGRRHKVFCASLADWLDDEVPIEYLADLLKLIHETPNLDWLLLTKRPENWGRRLAEVIASRCDLESVPWEWALIGWLDGEPPANVWIGVSVEDQKRADERVPALLKIPARVRFLSIEPLLGPVDLGLIGMLQDACEAERQIAIQWVIVGGESGPKARPCNIEWVRDIVRQCKAAGVPCFVKQLGANVVDNTGYERPEPFDRKRGDMSEWPEDLRVREFPKGISAALSRDAVTMNE